MADDLYGSFAKTDKELNSLIAAAERAKQNVAQVGSAAEEEAAARRNLARRVESEAAGGRPGESAASHERTADSGRRRTKVTDDAAKSEANLRKEVERRTAAEQRATRSQRATAQPRIGGRFVTQAEYDAAQAAGAGGGGRLPPQRPTAVGGLAGGPGGPGGRGIGQASAETERLAAAEARLRQEYASANPILRRHGALTTEFITAAARGEITIKELGYQVGSTIGKFGGWLGAGALVFGAVGALTAAGRGALDAASGVNQLQRVLNNVNADKLKQSFSDLSEQFNLPIGEVSDAVYQMGKVFKDQDSAVSAAATALYAVKIGELDVATATRYLTAIIHGANLSASDLAVVMDQVNQAQNQFGTPIEGTLAGLAKSTGSFLGSGGDKDSLLAYIASTQYLTGQTGDVAGTAFLRVPNYLSQAKNQATLKGFGLPSDPNKAGPIIQQALAGSRQGKYSQDDLREISYAIFGRFYGPRVGLPLLRNPDTVARFTKGTSPGAAAGSAQNELNTLLGSIEERIKKLPVELERIGNSLASTHLLDFFALVVVALGQGLKLTNSLIESFNQLPDPLKQVAAYALEAYGVMRLMSRLGVGTILAGGTAASPGGVRGAVARALGHESASTEARKYRTGLSREIASVQDDRAAQEKQALGYASRARGVSLEADEEERNLRRLKETGASQEDLKKSTERAANLRGIQLSHEESQLRAETEARYLRGHEDQLAATQAQATQRRGLLRRQPTDLSQFERRSSPGDIEQPTTVPSRLQGGAEEAAKAQEESVRSIRRQNAFLGASSVRAQQGLRAAATSAINVRGGYDRSASEARRFGSGLSGLLGGIGNLLFALGIAFTVEQLLKSASDDLGAKQAQLEAVGNSTKNLQGRLDSVEAQRQQFGKGIKGKLGDLVTGFDPGALAKDIALGPLGALVPGVGNLNPFGGKDTASNALRDQADSQRAQYLAQLSAENEALREGRAAPYRQNTDILTDAKKAVDGSKGRRATLRELGKLDKEVSHSLDAVGQGAGTPQQQAARVKQAHEKINVLRLNFLSTGKLGDALKDLSSDDLSKSLGGVLGGLDNHPRGRKSEQIIARARKFYEEATKRLKDSKNDPEELKKLQEVRKQFNDAISKQLQDQLGLIAARGKITSARLATPGNEVPQAQAELATLKQQLAFMEQHKGRFDLKDILDMRAQIIDAQNQLAQTVHQQAKDLADATADVAIARAQARGDDVGAAKAQVAKAQQDLALAQTPTERLQAQAELISQRAALANSIYETKTRDIEFQVAIGKETADQEIAAYQKLLHTLKLTKAQRQDLLTKIYNLRHDLSGDNNSNFELDTGNIKLPTVYDIRRAIGAGSYNNRSVQVTNSPRIALTVTDPNAVGPVTQALDSTLGTATGAAMRNAGLL